MQPQALLSDDQAPEQHCNHPTPQVVTHLGLEPWQSLNPMSPCFWHISPAQCSYTGHCC